MTPLSSQFPSTTTAHVSTVHFGVPVTEHGLYEWNCYEPSLDRIICPLLFSPSGTFVPGGLVGEMDPNVLAPGPMFYRRLETRGARSLMLGPDRISGSPFGEVASDGAVVAGFPDLEQGARDLAAAFAKPEGPQYVHLYWDVIDAVGHMLGPSSPQFDESARAALDALWAALKPLEGVTVLLTADHGQVDVSPERVDYLDEVWPELPGALTQSHPAGSARDVFLHVHSDRVDEVVGELGARLGERARVVRATELFDDIGPRLAERLGDVAVLPAPDREVWLRSCAGVERKFRGHHGGLDPAETETYLARLT